MSRDSGAGSARIPRRLRRGGAGRRGRPGRTSRSPRSPARPLDVDPPVPALLLAVVAEAGRRDRVRARTRVVGAQCVHEPALALRAPHDAADAVGSSVVLDEAEKVAAVPAGCCCTARPDAGPPSARGNRPRTARAQRGMFGLRLSSMIQANVLIPRGFPAWRWRAGERAGPCPRTPSPACPRRSGSCPCNTACGGSRSCRRGIPCRDARPLGDVAVDEREDRVRSGPALQVVQEPAVVGPGQRLGARRQPDHRSPVPAGRGLASEQGIRGQGRSRSDRGHLHEITAVHHPSVVRDSGSFKALR